jgi:hypothetical protein
MKRAAKRLAPLPSDRRRQAWHSYLRISAAMASPRAQRLAEGDVSETDRGARGRLPPRMRVACYRGGLPTPRFDAHLRVLLGCSLEQRLWAAK